jgi:hypothetical protein
VILAASINGSALADVLSLIGPSAVLKIHAGPIPTDCETASGALLARIALPSVWLTAGGSKVGEWREVNADGTGIASYFRIYTANEATCGLQGVIGAELRLDGTSFVAGEDFTVSRFRLTDRGGGMITCEAHGQSLFRRLIREMCRESGGTHGLVRYRTLLRDLKTAQSIPASRAGSLLLERGGVLTTESGVPFQLEGA